MGGDTRRALIDAAREVFAANGVTSSRIADITAAAGVSIGTFYTYFASKRRVLDTVLDELSSGLFPATTQGQLPPAEQAYLLNRHYLEAFAAHAALWYAIERAALTDDELATMLAQHRHNQVERVEAVVRGQHGPVEPSFTAFSLVAMTEECAYNWFVYESAPELDRAARGLADLWCRMAGAA